MLQQSTRQAFRKINHHTSGLLFWNPSCNSFHVNNCLKKDNEAVPSKSMDVIYQELENQRQYYLNYVKKKEETEA